MRRAGERARWGARCGGAGVAMMLAVAGGAAPAAYAQAAADGGRRGGTAAGSGAGAAARSSSMDASGPTAAPPSPSAPSADAGVGAGPAARSGDDAITKVITDGFQREPLLRGGGVTVTCEKGVVTLRGLASPAARGRAIDLARAATGVLVVIDEIGVPEE